MIRKLLTPLAAMGILGTAAALAGWIFQISPEKCRGCGFCVPWCPSGAIEMQGPDAWIDPALCNGCGECVPHCPFGAIYKVWWEAVEAPPELQDVTLSPSPTPGTVTVSGLPEGLRISAVDLSGREVGSAEASGGTVVMDLSGSCSGLVLISSDLGPVGAVVLLRP